MSVASYASGHGGTAGFGHRLGAFVIDAVILTVLQYAFLFGWAAVSPGAAAATGGEPAQVMGRFAVFYLVFVVAYVVGFVAVKGATPGKMVMGIRIVGADGGALGFGKAFLREIVGKIVSSVILYIGFLMAAFRADGRALHDLMARTVVVRSR